MSAGTTLGSGFGMGLRGRQGTLLLRRRVVHGPIPGPARDATGDDSGAAIAARRCRET